MLIKSKLMHIDRSNNVTMSCKATGSTCPISPFGLVFVPTYRTLATGSSFRASEAHDVSLFCLVCQVVDIPAIFPQSHPLVVVSAIVSISDTVRIADEELANVVLFAEVNDLTCRFVSEISYTSLRSTCELVLGPLQLLPPSGVFLASGLFLGNLAEVLGTMSLERTNATTRYHNGFPCVCGDGSKMNLTQVDCCVNLSRRCFILWLLYTDVQFKAIVPDKATRATLFRKCNWQNQRLASFAHRQNNSSLFFAHRLSGPFDRIEALRTPRILHLHLGMTLTELTCGVNGGKKSMDNHLHRLTMQGKLSLGCLLQFGASRPCAVRHPCLLMDLRAQVPNLSGFHLSGFQTSKQLRMRMQPVDIHGIHSCLLAFLLFLDMLFHGSENLSIERPIVLFCNLSHLFQQMSRKPDGESLDIFFHETIITPNCNYRQGLEALSSQSLKRDGTSRALLLKIHLRCYM